jgi:DNA (cytosine-5)-methyltransferase 1
MFIMENVPNMVTMENGHYKKKILGAFSRAGYKRTAIVPLVSSSFGVPQHRRRVFVFGLRDGLPCKEGLEQRIQKFLRKEELPDQVTVGEAISDLPERVSAEDAPVKYPVRRRRKLSAFQRLMRLDCDTRLLSKKKKGAAIDEHALHNHHTKGIESRRKKIIRAIQPGGTGDTLPTKLWSGVRGHKWRRLDPDQPSYTILAQMHRDLSEWIHPDYDRWITVREAARLQSFHDGFVLYGSECQQLKQVGNAVPPLMALAVARASKRLLESVSRTSARKR